MSSASIEAHVRELADREAIRDLARRYAHCVWQRDAAGAIALFADDGEMDTGDRPVIRGRAALLKAYDEMFAASELRPMVHNHVIDLDGDDATGACYLDLRAVIDGKDMIGAGYYNDPNEQARWYFNIAYSLLSQQDGAGRFQPPPGNSAWNPYSSESYAILILNRSVGGGCIDGDGDGECDVDDNCPQDPNPGQEDNDSDGWGNVCDQCPDSAAGDDPDPDRPGCPMCENVDPRSQGFWRRVCKKPHPDQPDRSFLTPELCEDMNPDPNSDPCEKARSQCAAVAYNVLSERVDATCTVDATGGDVAAALAEAAALIDEGTNNSCKAAQALCAGINEGGVSQP